MPLLLTFQCWLHISSVSVPNLFAVAAQYQVLLKQDKQ